MTEPLSAAILLTTLAMATTNSIGETIGRFTTEQLLNEIKTLDVPEKWEYIQIVITKKYAKHSNQTFYKKNEFIEVGCSDLKKSETYSEYSLNKMHCPIIEILNKYGNDGWELVTVNENNMLEEAVDSETLVYRLLTTYTLKRKQYVNQQHISQKEEEKLEELNNTENSPVFYEELILTPIEEFENLNLPIKGRNVLERAGIYTISDLLKYTKEDLLDLKYMRTKDVEEIVSALERKGFFLPEQ